MKHPLLFCFLFLTFLSACSDNEESQDQDEDHQVSQSTIANYVNVCSGCHGQGLENFEELNTQRLTVGEIADIIANGGDLGGSRLMENGLLMKKSKI